MNRLLAIAVAMTVVTVAAVLAWHGIDEDGLRAVIRATARLSAVFFALAFARIRGREFLSAVVVSHALHYAAILALASTTSPANAHIDAVSAVLGVAAFAAMLRAAQRPESRVIYVLWIVFFVAFYRELHQPLYPAILGMLIAAALLRFARAIPRASRA